MLYIYVYVAWLSSVMTPEAAGRGLRGEQGCGAQEVHRRKAERFAPGGGQRA